jgi:hypothetical protein
MDPLTEKPPFAWQPLTPRGVAAFARATWGRLLFVQLLMAMLVTSTVVCFVHARWFSVMASAIKALPSHSEIRGGNLQWPGDSIKALAENNYLALCVDLRHEGTARSPAHVQVEFGQKDFRVLSLFGCWQRPYPNGWIMAFNQPELEPWWGAWAPALLALVATVVFAGLIAVWVLLALIYAPVAWLVGFFNDRQLTLPGSWRLAGAALMPGALLLSACVSLYGFGLLDLIQLIALAVLHIVLGWAYVVYGALRAPLHPSITKPTANPFVEPETSFSQSETAPPAITTDQETRSSSCN